MTVEEVAEDVFLDVLAEAVRAVEEAGIPYVLMGGFASAALGRDRWTHDIDLFVKPLDARRVLDALEPRGFAVEETDRDWIYKGFKRGVLVDVIFCSADEVYLDDEMLERAQIIEFKGLRFRVIPPEDLLIIKARVHKEDTPRHWFDGLGIVRATRIDWDYLLSKAKDKPDRVLSLLLYARSLGAEVPDEALERLWECAAKHRGSGARRRQEPAAEADDYVAARIHARLAQEGFEVQVSVKEGRVLLTGLAGTPKQRADLAELVRQTAPGLQVEDRTSSGDFPEIEDVERLS